MLLGHTLDDQAETVLLGLARGAGARSLAGMAADAGALPAGRCSACRARSCGGLRARPGSTPWEDPHNADPAYARVRVRAAALPALEQALGPGVAAALARTARQLREDADALDALTPDTDDCAALAALPRRAARPRPAPARRRDGRGAPSRPRTSTRCARSWRTGAARGRSGCRAGALRRAGAGGVRPAAR